ncbi:hypothetical protein BH10BDE1_BH10BDE1_14280 [soil metagenome]
MAIASAIAAALIHGYLLKSHYDLHYGEVSGSLMCDISSRFSCSAASASRWAEFLGVPMALWGLLANVAFVTLAAWDPLTEGEGRPANRTGLLVISGVLALASVVMGVISLTSLNTMCPFCLVTYVLSLVTLAGTWMGYKPGLKLTFKLTFVGVVFAFGISAFILNDQLRSGYTDGQDTGLRTAAALQDWQQNPKLEIAETDPLSLGPSRAEAKMLIAEFADFRCIHCKLAAAPIKAFVNSHPDVRLEFYSWPLDGECNSSIQQANGASCLLARTVWCARNKAQKGWEAHEQVFTRFEEWKSTDAVRAGFDSLAKAIGMPAEDLKACADSDVAKSAILAQARLGSSLNIKGTPAIYVNGKLLPAGSSIPSLSAVYGTLR